MRKILSTWGMVILMLALLVGTAAAQSGVDPSATPTPLPTTQPTDSTPYQHPIIQILSAYFGRETRPVLPTPTPTVDPSATPTDTPTVDPSATPTLAPTPTPVVGPEEFAKQIALYREDGMGFGVLVKLYAMAEASVEACLKQLAAGGTVEPGQPACEAMTVEQLVTAFQGGTGLGELFNEYGKPALLGVGHVKKALKNLPEVTVTPTPTPAPSMEAGDPQPQNQKSNNGNKPVKVKTPRPQGPKK